MSLAFVPSNMRGAPPDQQATVQKLLDENSRLIDIIKEYQNQGRAEEAVKHQQLLHRNLMYLASHADQSLMAQLREDSGGADTSSTNAQNGGTTNSNPPAANNNGANPASYPQTSAYNQYGQTNTQPVQQGAGRTPNGAPPVPNYPYNQGRPYPSQGYEGQVQQMPPMGYPPVGQNQQFMR